MVQRSGRKCFVGEPASVGAIAKNVQECKCVGWVSTSRIGGIYHRDHPEVGASAGHKKRAEPQRDFR